MTLCLPDAPWTWFQQHKLERKCRQRNVPNRKVLEREQMSDPEQVKADDARISSQVKKMKEEIITPLFQLSQPGEGGGSPKGKGRERQELLPWGMLLLLVPRSLQAGKGGRGCSEP